DETHKDILAGKPGGLWITFPTTFDPSLAPDGEHLVILSSIARYDVGRPWSEARGDYVEPMLAEIERLLPGFRDRITFMDTATPETMERYTLNHRGAIYGWEATPTQSTGKRLKQRSPIDGLYLAGHWTEPGAGGHCVRRRRGPCLRGIRPRAACRPACPPTSAPPGGARRPLPHRFG